MRSLLCILLLAMTGCASWGIPGSSLTQEERATVVSRARALALGSGLVHESERAVVESDDPTMSYYFLSGRHDADYWLTWKVSAHERVTVRGRGDLLTLEEAEVKRLPDKAGQTTAAAPGS